jgi:Cd2+/Zn2+-exporting ATPase/Cu+-exporting ATPase
MADTGMAQLRSECDRPSPDGYGVRNARESESPAPEHPAIETADMVRIILVAAAAAAVWFRIWEPYPRLSVIGLCATLIGGYPIFREALHSVAERRMTMELSMWLALTAALVIREFFTALVITLFVLVAEVIEGMTISRGRQAIRDLLSYLPHTALIRRPEGTCERPVSEIHPGDTVLVNPGTRLPVDGVVVGGHSFVDQSTITGESSAVEKTSGAMVYAGTVNQTGALEVRAERLGRDTTFGKIVEAVEKAERSRAPVQKIADRLAGYLVYFALAAAGLTLLLTHNVRSTISVVIVAGACGIAAGTPLAILGAIGQAARRGIIVKGGLYLETLATVDTVVLDKTGTLTYGVPKVWETLPADGVTHKALLEAAAIAEIRSEHPLAKAVLARAGDSGVFATEPERFVYQPGQGVIATLAGEDIVAGNRAFFRELSLDHAPAAAGDGSAPATEILVARNGRYLGSIRVGDTLRPEARQAVDALRSLHIGTLLLTGDARPVAEATARDLGVDDVGFELLPEQKAQRVKALASQGRRTAMVGDGINDAPAMVEAAVGVAMGSGTDVARESADVVLLGNDLLKFVQTIQIARRTRRIIMQNFAGTLIVDAIGIALAAFGFLSPMLAAFIHVSSELTFVGNSARLMAGRRMGAKT